MNFSATFIRRPVATSLLMLGIAMFGLIAELLGVNRKLLEDVQWRLRRMEYGAAGSGWERPNSADANENGDPR